jgi:hypothetical protein
MKMRRRARLAASPEVGAPIVLGGSRPLVVVPPDFVALPETLRRAALRHELAHLRRGDDLMRPFEALVRAAFWFHPLVRWLVGRIDRERELLCDEVALADGTSPREFARLLLEFARRPRVRLGAAAIPLFGRGTVGTRIERLLDDRQRRWMAPLPRGRASMLGLGALLALLGVGSVRVVGDDRPRDDPARSVPADEARAPGQEVEDKGQNREDDAQPKRSKVARALVPIRVTVLDADTGAPLTRVGLQPGVTERDGTVMWGGNEVWPSPKPVESADGHYVKEFDYWTLEPERIPRRAQNRLRVLADGYLPADVLDRAITPDDAPAGLDATVRLRKGRSVAGRVLRADGTPAAGARLVLIRADGGTLITSGVPSALDGLEQIPGTSRARADAEGRFTLAGVGHPSDRIAVHAPPLDLWLTGVPADGDDATIRLPEPGAVRMRYAIENDEPKAKLFINLLKFDDPSAPERSPISIQLHPEVANNDAITLENLPPGTYLFQRERTVHPNNHFYMVYQQDERVRVEPGRTAAYDLVRDRGFPVVGKVEGLDAYGVGDALVILWAGPSEDKAAFEAVVTERGGKFRTVRVPPGRYIAQVSAYLADTAERQFRQGLSGWPSPEVLGEAEVVVPEDRAPDPLIIRLGPPERALPDLSNARLLRVEGDDLVEAPQDGEVPGPAEKVPEGPATAAPPKLTVRGTVLDSETDQPIERFRVIPGAISTTHITWQPHLIKGFERGSFVIVEDPEPDRLAYRVEAEGYAPAFARRELQGPDLRALRGGRRADETWDLTLRLRRDPGLSGVVLTPDGQPDTTARVALATPSREVEIDAAKVRFTGHAERLGARVAQADRDGRFRLDPESDSGRVVAASQTGYAEVHPDELKRTGTIRLKPWGQIEGRVLADDRPVAGREVAAGRLTPEGSDSPFVHWHSAATTNDGGRFLLSSVPEGRVVVQRWFPTVDGGKATPSGAEATVEVRSGQITHIILGGTGRTLSGRVEAPADLRAFDGSRVRLEIFPEAPHIGMPGDEALWKVYQEFLASDEGRGRVRRDLRAGRDGAFRVEGVPEGRYQLRAVVEEDGAAILNGAMRFDVPAGPAVPADEPIDLGTIPLQPR